MAFTKLCKTSDVQSGAGKGIEINGKAIAVFNVDGKFYAINDVCGHRGGPLSEGEIDGEVVECNFHNGAFHIPTGRVEAPPCMVPLKTYVTSVVEGKVCIEAP